MRIQRIGRSRVGVLIAVVCLAVLTACGSSSDDDTAKDSGGNQKVTVKLANVRSGLFAPLYVAQERGYFAKQNVNLEVSEVSTLQDAFPLLASGQLDAAIGGVSSGMFSAIDQGFDLKMVASIASAPGTKPSPTALVVRKSLIDSGEVKSLKDLTGRKIAAAGGASGGGGWNLMVMLRQAKMSITKVNVVALANPDMLNSLKSGAVDAAVVTAPFSTAIVKEGIGVEFGDPLPRGYGAGALVYSADFAKTPGAQRVYDALAKGEKDVGTEGPSSDSIASIVAMDKYVGQDVAVIKSSPNYAYDLKLFRPETHAKWFVELQQESIKDGYLKIKAPIPIDRFVDTRFADASSVK
ncbi:ABC transporter substrate-binding protein [Actinophytocola oryzae]|uniref:NitT/TauT family transport system substrate-binding protein n=1 Tax=Actinophytocola oryzae TaxID=502181 RepID=A0A4R7W722_9PSEU|nr:ABC transporter substrate-binding protein [Actinophytocola oryzae]TDV57839.1 NitT/TauT family transport system substrate-binding protein [Actinophytocola oryzae]